MQVLEAWSLHFGFQKSRRQGRVLRENINYVLSKIHRQLLTSSQFPLCKICAESLSTQTRGRENLGRVSFGCAEGWWEGSMKSSVVCLSWREPLPELECARFGVCPCPLALRFLVLSLQAFVLLSSCSVLWMGQVDVKEWHSPGILLLQLTSVHLVLVHPCLCLSPTRFACSWQGTSCLSLCEVQALLMMEQSSRMHLTHRLCPRVKHILLHWDVRCLSGRSQGIKASLNWKEDENWEAAVSGGKEAIVYVQPVTCRADGETTRLPTLLCQTSNCKPDLPTPPESGQNNP